MYVCWGGGGGKKKDLLVKQCEVNAFWTDLCLMYFN